jgi:hypothetical protein
MAAPNFHLNNHTLHHHQLGDPRRSRSAMNHDEIWDDSALVDSWNEALEEYKVHSRLPLPSNKVSHFPLKHQLSPKKEIS